MRWTSFMCVALLAISFAARGTDAQPRDSTADHFDESEVETVFPVRLGVDRTKRDVSTATENGHVEETSILVKTKNKDLILDIKRNKGLLSPSFVVRSYASDNSDIIHQDPIDHCYYHGEVRGSPDSDVVLSTCSGLKGLIDDGDVMYNIEPHENHEQPGAHKFYPARDAGFHEGHDKCGNDGEFSFKRSDIPASKTKQRFRREIDEFYRDYFVTEETRYNEMVFSVDFEMYLGHNNDTKFITDRVITLVNAVDRAYQRINIRLVMKGIEIWSTGDPFVREWYGGPDLSNFRTYRNEKLFTKFGDHDNAHLLRHRSWLEHVVGMAWVGGMCSTNSEAVNAWDYDLIVGPYVVLGHEMGHNFGFSHDTGTCKCLTPRGCFMGGPKTLVPGFSNCSMNALKNVNDACLYNVPTEAINERCGNGIREGDEECDCGTPEMCKDKDPCCEPYNCVLKPSTQCSDLHHECCENCLFKKQGTLCRGVMTDCDVPEYCTGDSRDCPANSYIQDGYPCNRTVTLIKANTNRYSVVTKQLNPYIEARFVRINPQYYHGLICARTELYGCSADQVSPTSPSPLRSYDNYCLKPEVGSCAVQDGSKIIFTEKGECGEDFMQFSLDENGILRHHCSGKMVCPENGGTWNGVKLTVSSSCKEEDSKFERTVGKSLKHVRTGKCVHPNGGWPGLNRALLIWSSCDERRLEIWFMKQDCAFPLGIASGKIPDDQITGSSYRESDFPHNARLDSNKFWCSKNQKSDKNEYLQIDFGEIKTIQSVAMQGRGSWYYWVTAYHLYYSKDGEIWTAYSESGDSEHSNANCYLGKCSETHATQCQDLWGGTAQNGDVACYDTLNTNGEDYGTCTLYEQEPCAKKDVLCGQLQCMDKADKPDLIDFGKNYTKITLKGGEQCSGAILHDADGDSLGHGMVLDGTKCGDGKMCRDNKCQSYSELGIKPCPDVDGKECAGRGVCTNEGKCHCNNEYDPDTACESVLPPRDGQWEKWTEWSVCTKGCGGGKRTRHRFCDNPFPRYGGADCAGDKGEEEKCNTETCPVGISCRQIQQKARMINMDLPDGVYTINPTGSNPMPAYCDMSRDGGGWTLLVTSHTNSWTSQNVLLRNKDTPQLTDDYSILSHADSIKDNLNVEGATFEYRLEASKLGHWGGIWEAPRPYSFVSTDNKQINVELKTMFDEWEYKNSGIEKRMPWVAGARLTTSTDAFSWWYGTVTGDDKQYHPAPWINARLAPRQPSHIWYWMKEGPLKIPRSCMDIQMRGLEMNKPIKDGVYTIKPPGQKDVRTYCDMTTNGGGWTLVATSKTHSRWSKENVKERNMDNPSLNGDFSILGSIDAIKDFDPSQDFFQYRIEADETKRWGGIWEAPSSYNFLSSEALKVKIVEKFDSWDDANNLANSMPRLDVSRDIFLSAASSLRDPSGSIIYNDGNIKGTYLKEKPNPGVVRYWMREGARRSCNDIKVHGVRAGNTYQDGSYMIQMSDKSQYLPVYCDMTTDDGGFTLLVTSANSGWTPAQVFRRNMSHPSLNADYSILELGDFIKSLSNGNTFKYMMDANQRRHWGGIFEAPISYSFVATSPDQTKVNLTKKFNEWEFNWYSSLNLRMPWVVASGSNNMSLLTTSYSATYYPSGSILWEGTDRNPADWIWAGGMRNPGLIWYWVNEDDCDADRKAVDGGMTEWSNWGRCDKLCESGKQTRQKTCSQPKPRCGGKQCDPTVKTVEQRDCYYCPESPIRSTYGHMCVKPEKPGCTTAELEDSYLVFKKEDEDCTATEAAFVFDRDGVLYHKCSMKMVCPEGGRARYKMLVLKDECDKEAARLTMLPNKLFKNVDTGQCIHPYGGWPSEGAKLTYWVGCQDLDRLELEFIKDISEVTVVIPSDAD